MPGTYIHSTVGYANNRGSGAGCSGTAGADRMYLVVVPSGFMLTASTSGVTTFDPSIALIRGEDGLMTNPPCVASNDNGDATTLNVVTVANGTFDTQVFFVVIDSSSPSSGSYNLTVALSALPPGETGELAEFVEPGTHASQTTAGYSNDIFGTATGCSTANAGPDRCYAAVVPAGQTINFMATPVAGFDLSLSLIRGVDLATLPRTCLTNSNAGGAGVADQVSFTNSGSGAEVVVLVVDSSSTPGNGFSLQVTVAATAIGETAAKPEIVSTGLLAGQTTVGYANDVSSAGTNCAAVTGRDRFYAVSVPPRHRLTATVTPDLGYDPNISLLGLIHTMTCLAGVDAAGAGAAEIVSWSNPSAEARTIIVRIDSATVGDPGGGFSLDLQTALVPAGDLPRFAETIAGTVAGSTEPALGYANDFSPPVSWTGFANPGADRFYRITVAAADQLIVTLTPSAGFDGSVYITPAFGGDSPLPFLLAGTDTANPADSHTLMWSNTGDAPRAVWVVVDGKNAGGGTYTLNATAATAGTGDITVRDGALATDPLLADGQAAAVAFGDTTVGTGKTRTFRVENASVATLTLSGVTFSGGAFTAASSNLPPSVSIPCGGSTTFNVTLTPSAAAADFVIMHLASDDVDESPFDVQLSINGVPPNPEIVLHNGSLATDPELVDGQTGAVVFASPLAGSGVTRTFLVRNTGTTILQVSGITFSNAAGVTATSSVAAPFNVAAGASASFTVTLTPASVGTFSPDMHIGTTDADENPFDVPLSITANASAAEFVMHDGNSISFPQIADGQVTPVDFGATTASVGITHTFLVRNTGTTSLTLSSVTFSGGSGTTATTSFTTARNVAANATTTFTVTLSRAALGSDSVQMQIANNDADENPFDVPLAFTVVSQLPGETATGPVFITDGGSISGTTQNYVNNLNFTSACTGFTTPGRDRFYQITLAAGQQITAAIQPTSSSFDPAIYLIRASEAGSASPTCLAGDDAGGATTINIITYRNIGAVPEDVVIGVDSASSTGQGNFVIGIVLDPPNASPEIVVEQPSGSGLADGSSTVVFNADPVGVGGTRVFTVRNTGTGALAITSVTTTGGNAGDFTVNTTGMLTSVPATTGSTTFTVTFTPMVASSRTTTLRIVNDDSNENPFDITLTGSGNTAPVFLGITLNTVQGQPVALSEVKMLLRASDADGQAVSITGVGATSTQGAAISRSGGVITYATPAAYVGADTFTVLLTDGLTSINGTITVNVTADPGLNPNNPPKITVLGGGPVSVGFFGIPGRTYGIQRSTNLTDWTQIGAPTANANGAVTLTDPSPSEPSAFYRVIFPAE